MRLYRSIVFMLVFAGCAFLFSGCASSHKTRETVRAILLETPTDYRMAAYLGFFKPRKNFMLTDIKTDLLVANVFQSRCPHCRGLTKNLNKIYSLVEKEGLFHKIKFIGLGYGDDFIEVTLKAPEGGTIAPGELVRLIFDVALDAPVGSIVNIIPGNASGVNADSIPLSIRTTGGYISIISWRF